MEGTIGKSYSKEYIEGEQFLFFNTNLVHYPHTEGFWKDHFVMSTNTGIHFYLAASDQLP